MTFLPHLVFTFFILFILFILHGGYAVKIIYEDGYTVKTVIDGNKLKINPRSVGPLPGTHDILLLDSSGSAFYSLSSPLSQESVVKKFAGNGMPGYSDGDAISAMFDKPRGFTVDTKGNVYVADRSNFAIRKISRSGVTTTIAGGFSKSAGRVDGPGRNATFSPDYELTFAPQMCALLVVDHGNKLIRQIDLKQEDCGSSKSGLGVTAMWAAALAVPCLVGLVIGFVSRPYIMPQEGINLLDVSKSWMTSYRTNLGSQALMHYFGTRNAVASRALSLGRKLVMLVMSHVSLLVRFRMKKTESSIVDVHKDYVSLLDQDCSSSSGCAISQKYTNQLRDLITFNEDPGSSSMAGNILNQENGVNKQREHPRQIEDLMLANITNFAENAFESTVVEGSFLGVSTVVKRK